MINLNELPRYGVVGRPTGDYLKDMPDGYFVKFDDVEALIKKIVLRLEMMDASRMTTGHGESDEFYPARPIKRLIADLSAPKGTTAMPYVGEID